MTTGWIFYCRPDGRGARFKVHLVPRASRNSLEGLHGDALKVRLSAPPVEGRANEALLKYLAGVLGVTQQALELVAGRTGRSKVLRVEGLSPDEVAVRLGLVDDLPRP
ncbi:MAG: DUF167 domain-containing protein [Thermodesulfobacteriota bacterium]